MRVGDIELVALHDGECRMPQDFYANLDFPGLELGRVLRGEGKRYFAT